MFKYLELVNTGFNIYFLELISIFAIISGILVIVSKNPIVSVLFLIGLFLSISIFLMFLGLNFIGLSYLLVYVGAVSILFLFILMLINIRVSEITSSSRNSIPLGIIIGILFLNIVSLALPSNDNLFKGVSGHLSYFTQDFFNNILNFFNLFSKDLNETAAFSPYFENNNIHSIYYCSWDSFLSHISHISNLGNIIYSSFFLLILLCSLVLLLSMVGCILITLRN